MPRELPSHVWVGALIRRAEVGGAFAVIAHRGDPDRGDVLVKVVPGRGQAQLYAPAFGLDGPSRFERVFRDGETVADEIVEAMIARRRKSDPDLWVIEIDDRTGRHFLTEPVD